MTRREAAAGAGSQGCVLDVDGLSAGYGSVPAITGVTLSVRAGEMVALLGANGAGKTTTLLAMAGALEPAAGKIEMFGRPEKRKMVQRIRDGLALLPDQKAVFMGLSVRSNLMLGRGPIEQALGLFPELKSRLDIPAGLVSGGEQQMLAVARVLAAEPRIVLADEISLGLAPLVTERLFQALASAAGRGAAVVVVEQHPRIVLRWSDRAYVMRRGRVVHADESKALLERPESLASLYL